MRLQDFWGRMEGAFGRAYAHSLASDYTLPLLRATVDEALRRGDEPKRIWQAVCAEFEVPKALV